MGEKRKKLKEQVEALEQKEKDRHELVRIEKSLKLESKKEETSVEKPVGKKAVETEPLKPEDRASQKKEEKTKISKKEEKTKKVEETTGDAGEAKATLKKKEENKAGEKKERKKEEQEEKTK